MRGVKVMSRGITLAVVTILLGFGPASVTRSQAPTPSGEPRSIYTLKIFEDLVLVDVTVTDKKGKPVKNLHKEDFTVLEDNVPQNISTFDFEDLSASITGETQAAGGQRAAVIDLAKTPFSQLSPEVLRDRRLLILLIDQSSMPVEDLIQAQKTVKDFIEKQLTPADLVAVVSNTSTIKLLQDFTNDREVLQRAVSRLYAGESAGLAETGTTDTETTGDSAEDTSDAFVPDETQFNIFNTDRKLSAIESVGKMFRSLPGRKFLVHFSSGISTTGVENQAQLRSTISTLNQANTSLYSVDVRGLIALVPGGDASKGSAGGTANYSGKAFRDQSSSMANSQETLVALAHDTGGRALLDSNDLGRVFQEVREDSSSYYILGYSPSNTKRDGRFRQIKLQVNVPGLRLKYRQGYFAPKSFGQFTQADKERQLEEAVSTERPFNDIPFLVAANYVQAGNSRVYVPVSFKFAASEIPFQQKGKKNQAEFDFIGQVKDSKDHIIGSVRDTIRLNLEEESYRKARAAGIQYGTGFYLPAGSYSLKFLLRENQTGKMSSFEQPLSVPDFMSPTLSISSVVLSNRLEPAGKKDRQVMNLSRSLDGGGQTTADPLVIDQMRVVPNVARVFSPNDTLYIFFQTYLRGQKGSHPHLNATLAFLKDGRIYRDAGKVSLDEFDKGAAGTITSDFQVPLSEFAKGDYVLQVSVVDSATQASVAAQERFAVR